MDVESVEDCTAAEADHLVALRRDLAATGLRAGRIEQVGGGRSALTALADIESGAYQGRVAVRAELPGGGGLSIGSLTDMFALLEQLRLEGIAAPAPILVSEQLPGATYDLLVTEFVSGEVPHPWRRAGRDRVRELREGRRFGREFVETLAGIHRVHIDKLPDAIAHERHQVAQNHPARSRQRSRGWLQNSGAFAFDPVLNYVDEWLRCNQPEETFAAGLVHGDYRMGNVVVQGDSIGSVLDWELAEAGEVLSDVAWLCGPQGQIDGYAAGLFSQDELVAEYESATGRRIPSHLFSYLRVEGTLRTAAVWAQLSVEEARRGDFALQRRCHDSVLRLIGQCAQSLGIPTFSSAISRDDDLLLRGLAITTRAVVADLRSEGGVPSLGPAARSATLLIDRVAALLAGGPYGDYTEHCQRFVSSAGVDLPSEDLSTPEQLTWVLQMLAAQHAESLNSAEVIDLVARSAAPGIAFANQMVMFARLSAQSTEEYEQQ